MPLTSLALMAEISRCRLALTGFDPHDGKAKPKELQLGKGCTPDANRFATLQFLDRNTPLQSRSGPMLSSVWLRELSERRPERFGQNGYTRATDSVGAKVYERNQFVRGDCRNSRPSSIERWRAGLQRSLFERSGTRHHRTGRTWRNGSQGVARANSSRLRKVFSWGN